LLGIGVIAALVLGFQIVAYATVSTDSGFEAADGNLAPNPAGLNFDWNSFAPVSWLQPGDAPYREADKVVSGWTFKGIEDDQVSNADTAFSGGVKQDDECAATKGAKAPNKDDLKRIYLSTKTATSGPSAGDVFLNLAWVRIPQNTTSASAHVAFEFNQSTVECDPPSSGLVERTAGDMLIVYDFEGGGNPVVTLRRWTTSGPCEVGSETAPCWGTAANLTNLGFAEAAINTGGPVLDSLTPPTPPATQSVNSNPGASEFGEAGINLTDAGVFGAGTCANFGNVFAVSRSSGNSGTAQMKDLVGPADFTLANCGSVIIRKVTDPAGDTTTSFGYTTNVTTTPATTTTPFSLKDGESNEILNVNAATGRTVTEDDPSTAGYTLDSIDCSASTVPEANISPVVGTRTVTFSIAAGQTLDCTFTNSLNRETTLNTLQTFIPNDTANITGTGITGDGSVNFKLLEGTLGDETDETCANAETTDTVVYEETVTTLTGTNPFTASTDNPGVPGAPGETDGFTIDTDNQGDYYWKVTYTGIDDPSVTSCNELSNVLITNGDGVTEPPPTP
jgi:hypothetical protein